MERIFYSKTDAAIIYCYSDAVKRVRVLYNGVEITNFALDIDVKFTDRMIVSNLDSYCNYMISAILGLQCVFASMLTLKQYDVCENYADDLMAKEDQVYANFIANGGKEDWEE